MRKIIKNLFFAITAQLISVILSLIMSMVVPKFLGVEQYAYWQLFLLYINYIGVTHFGLIDGIYLNLGGKKREQIVKEEIKSQYVFFVAVQIFFAAVAWMVGSTLFADEPYRIFVIGAFSVFLVLANVCDFWGYIFQAINDTHKYSLSVIIDKIFFIVCVIILLIKKIETCTFLISLYLLAKFLSFVYLHINAADFLCAHMTKWKTTIRNIKCNVCCGIKLMIANLSASLILGVFRMMVDNNWGIMKFGKISFSLSMINFILAFLIQIGMVLFPALKQVQEKNLKKYFKYIRDVSGFVFLFVFVLFIPLKSILGAWLPQYSESLNYFALLLPICIFEGRMNLLCNTYYKILREEKKLLLVNLISMFGSLFFNYIAIFVFNNMDISIFFVVCILGARSIVSEVYLTKRLLLKWNAERTLQEVVFIFLFELIYGCLNNIYAEIVIIIMYTLYVLKNKSELAGMFREMKKIKKGL